VQKDRPNALTQAKIAKTPAAKHVNGRANELAVSKVKDSGDVVTG
jgi:hypothetical protein